MSKVVHIKEAAEAREERQMKDIERRILEARENEAPDNHFEGIVRPHLEQYCDFFWMRVEGQAVIRGLAHLELAFPGTLNLPAATALGLAIQDFFGYKLLIVNSVDLHLTFLNASDCHEFLERTDLLERIADVLDESAPLYEYLFNAVNAVSDRTFDTYTSLHNELSQNPYSHESGVIRFYCSMVHYYIERAKVAPQISTFKDVI